MRRHGTRAYSYPCLLLAFWISTGCGGGPEKPEDPNLASPKIALLKPAAGDKPKAGEELVIEGEVTVQPGAWMPSVVIVKILGDKEGRVVHGSAGVYLRSDAGTAAVHPFAASLKAPPKSGKYFAQALGMRDLRGQPGEDRVATHPMPFELVR